MVIPSVRKAQPTPSIYIASGTETCMGNSDADRRDITVVLLALRLAIRASDIAKLKILDIDFDVKEISFVQKKTQIPQRLELLSEIEAAIKTYISSSRPASEFRPYLVLRQSSKNMLPSQKSLIHCFLRGKRILRF